MNLEEAKRQMAEAQKVLNPERVTVGEFKGKPVLRIEGNHRPLSFGVNKARLILSNIEEIQKFVKSYGNGV